jgi:hypothetical protein
MKADGSPAARRVGHRIWAEEVSHDMVGSESIEDAVEVVITLDARRARLRRRRRRDAIREWAGLAAVAAIGMWLAILAVFTLVAH